MGETISNWETRREINGFWPEDAACASKRGVVSMHLVCKPILKKLKFPRKGQEVVEGEEGGDPYVLKYLTAFSDYLEGSHFLHNRLSRLAHAQT